MGYSIWGTPYLCPYLRIYYLAGIQYILCKYAHTRRCPYMRGCREKGCRTTNITLNPLHPDQVYTNILNKKIGPHKGGLFPFYPFWKKNIKRQPSFLKNLFGVWKIYINQYSLPEAIRVTYFLTIITSCDKLLIVSLLDFLSNS